MGEVIVISYAHNGQMGPRPRPVPHLGSFRFVCNDPGTLEIEFLDDSPLQDGARIVGVNKDFTAFRTGRFRFKCTLTDPAGKKRVLGDPAVPSTPPGGELEIGPG